MARGTMRRTARWRRRVGLALLVSGTALVMTFALSAKWWFGYGTESWLVDLGDGTLYTQAITPNDWSRPLVGWCGGVNREYLPSGASRSWTWTWWTWGERKSQFEPGRAYTVWPLAPVMMLSGVVMYWPAHRAARRQRRNQCVGCGYSRAGLEAQAVCPECGRGTVS